MDARRWLVRASLALGLIVIPLNFSAFIVNAADFVKTDSVNGATLWVDREVENFPLQQDWKLVKVKVRLHDREESRQTYLVDFTHSRSALIEADGQPIPVAEWAWQPGVPEKR